MGSTGVGAEAAPAVEGAGIISAGTSSDVGAGATAVAGAMLAEGNAYASLASSHSNLTASFSIRRRLDSCSHSSSESDNLRTPTVTTLTVIFTSPNKTSNGNEISQIYEYLKRGE